MTIAIGNVTTTPTAMYTSTGNTAITYLNLCNYSGANVTANVYVVPNGSSFSTLNQNVANQSITTLDSFQYYVGPEKLLVENGDTVVVSCSANNSINCTTSFISI